MSSAVPEKRSGSPAVLNTRDRHSEFDVTNTVRVSSVDAVREAVLSLLRETYPRTGFDLLWLAFHDFGRLFGGQFPGYVGCDTIYHDTQHSLDMALAMARLIAGYELSCAEEDRLGPERATLGIICALFHDAGYIRQVQERANNGAELTTRHVSRSAEFLSGYLPRIGLGSRAPVATRLVHFTGYEYSLDELELEDPLDSLVGHLLGTADLLAQMSDRCYLEKCRDRLYPEFVLAGVVHGESEGTPATVVGYRSGIDLLMRTPDFYKKAVRERLDRNFNGAWRYVEALFGGQNPYMFWIERNLAHLRKLITAGAFSSGLRRKPPCFTVLPAPVEAVRGLASRQLARVDAPAGTLPVEDPVHHLQRPVSISGA